MADEELVEEIVEDIERTSDRAAADAQSEGTVSDDADVEVEREEDAPAVEELDPETRARRDAALRQVRKFGDPVLRATARGGTVVQVGNLPGTPAPAMGNGSNWLVLDVA